MLSTTLLCPSVAVGETLLQYPNTERASLNYEFNEVCMLHLDPML